MAIAYSTTQTEVITDTNSVQGPEPTAANAKALVDTVPTVTINTGAGDKVLMIATLWSSGAAGAGSLSGWTTLIGSSTAATHIMYLYSATAVNATYSPTGQSSGKTSFEDVDNPGDYYAYASQHNFLSITAYTGAANTSPVYTTASSGSAGSPSVTGAAQFTTSAVHNVAYAWYLSAGVPTTTGTPHTARYTPVFGSSRDAPILVSTVNTTSASSLAYSWTAASTGWTMYFIEVFADGVSPTYFSKVVVSQTGGYRVSLSFDGSFDGGGNTFYWWVYINNTTYTGINFSAATSTTAINLKSEDFLALNAGDYLCVRCWRQAADAVRITNLSMMKLMVEKVS